MSKRNIAYLTLFILLVVVGGIAYFSFNKTSEPTPTEDAGLASVPPSQVAYNDLIVITSPAKGSTVTSPVSVSGKARGTWYFEASFPLVVLDANGNVLGQGYAQAQGDPEDGSADEAGWMTGDYVLFEGSIEFASSTTKTGTILFKKDNPSGMPKHDDSVGLPVRFAE